MLKKPIVLLAALLVGIAFMAKAADGDIVDATNPETVRDIASGYGSATLDTDNTGDPMIVGRLDGTKYGIYFYGCKEGKKCRSVQFSAGWAGSKVTLEQLDEWNRTTRFGKAYLDKDGDPRLEMDVNLDGGVTRKNFDDWVDWWKVSLKGFKSKVLDL